MPQTDQFEQLAGFLNNSPWFAKELLGNTLGDYLSVLGSVFIVWLAASLFTRLLRVHAKKFTSQTNSLVDDMIVELIHRSITFILVLTTLYFGITSLALPVMVNEVSAKLFFILFTLKITKELDRFSHFCIQSYLLPHTKGQRKVTHAFLRPLSRLSKLIIWSLAILLIVGNLGYNISSLLAGLGVGGLAFALAAQETLGNTFGSIALLTDQPFKVGDFVQIEGVEGTVTSIGLRSTQIQTIDQNIVTIPNKVTASATVINYSQREAFNVNLKIGIGFQTSSSKITELTKAIKQILSKDPAVQKDNFRINVTAFRDYAIELTVFYYINDVSTYARSIALRERINLKIKSSIEKMGIDIPFPTQSLRIENATNILPAKGRRKVNK